MDSLTLWYFKKYKKSGLNVNDLLDAEIKYSNDTDDTDYDIHRLPCLFKDKENVKRQDINYGYVATNNKISSHQKTHESSKMLNNNDNNNSTLGVNDYLYSISNSFHKDRFKNRKSNIKLSNQVVGEDDIFYVENDLKNLKMKSTGNKANKRPITELMNTKYYSYRFSNDNVSTKTKLKPISNDDTMKRNYLQDLTIQNKQYPWINLEKYLNTNPPNNPPNSPIPFVAIN